MFVLVGRCLAPLRGAYALLLLYRQFYNSVSPEVLLRIYTATVRPHLEYGAQVWDPHLVKDSVCLENVQKLALKICTKNWDLSYNALLNITGIPALKDRRQYLKLCTFFSIVNSMFFFNYSIPQVSSHRYSHNTLPLYQEPRARTNAYHSSFIPRTIHLWNNLPADALQSCSLQQFKYFISPLFL